MWRQKSPTGVKIKGDRVSRFSLPVVNDLLGTCLGPMSVRTEDLVNSLQISSTPRDLSLTPSLETGGQKLLETVRAKVNRRQRNVRTTSRRRENF